MKRLFLLFIILFSFETIISSPRTNPKNQAKESERAEVKPPELSDEERDSMLITSGMGILGAVVSIFIDRHNIPHVKTQLFALLAGLQQFVSYMVRTPLSVQQEEQIVEQLLEYLEQIWTLEQK